MPSIYLVSATSDDRVPGHELADPECPQYPGLLEKPEVRAWLDAVGYSYEAEDELVYLLTDDDPGTIPDGFKFITIEV